MMTMNNKYIYYILGLTISLAAFLPKVNSVIADNDLDATASATEDKQAIKDSLKARLNEIIKNEKEGDQNLSEAYKQKSNPNQEYAYFGNITEATNSSLLIAAQASDTKKTNYDDKTLLQYYLGGGSFRKVDPKDIKLGWFAIIIGNLQTDNSIKAKQIKLYNEKLPETEKTIVSGKITEIDNKTISFTSDQEYTAKIPNKYFLKIEGVDESDIADVSIGDKLIAIVEESLNRNSTPPNEDLKDSYTIKSMYIFPSLKNPIAEENQIKEASGTATATKSAEGK